jgi:hypothetical protein
VVIETGLVVGYVIAWALRKGKRVAGRLDAEVDTALDTGLDQLHTLVADKLGADPALTDLQDEATSAGQVSDLTRQRMELSVQAAASRDETFAAAVTAWLSSCRGRHAPSGRSGREQQPSRVMSVSTPSRVRLQRGRWATSHSGSGRRRTLSGRAG